MKNLSEQIVVINGMHRSGTMLFSRLVNALPHTFIVKDGLRIPWIYFQVEAQRFTYPKDCYQTPTCVFNLDKTISDVTLFKELLLEEVASFHLSEEVQRDLVEEIESCKPGMSYKHFFLSFFGTMARRTGCPTVGMKTTHMYQYARQMLLEFPQMKWIDILRDSRGWYCSSRISHSRNMLGAIRLWNKAADCLRYGVTHNSERYMFVTFEELVLTRVEALQKVSDFLGLDFTVSDSWLSTIELTENNGTQWFPNSSYTRTGEEVHGDQNQRRVRDYSVMDPLPVYRWRTKLSKVAKLLVWLGTFSNLQRLGFAKYNDKRL